MRRRRCGCTRGCLHGPEEIEFVPRDGELCAQSSFLKFGPFVLAMLEAHSEIAQLTAHTRRTENSCLRGTAKVMYLPDAEVGLPEGVGDAC